MNKQEQLSMMSASFLPEDGCDTCPNREGEYKKLIDRVKSLSRDVYQLQQEATKKPISRVVKIAEEMQKKHSSIQELKNRIKADGCCLCGYKSCLPAIEFHHTKTKGKGIGSIVKVEDLVIEIETHPVVLLCANCHRELHAGYINPDFTGKRVIL